MGRGFEDLMLAEAVASARALGLERVRGVYIPAPKNAKIAGFYRQNGFAAAASDGNEEFFEIGAAAFAPQDFRIALAGDSNLKNKR